MTIAPQPPGPGLPFAAPSVKTMIGEDVPKDPPRCNPTLASISRCRGLAACAIDVLNQRLDRAPAPGRVRPGPPFGAKARTGIALCALSEVPHGIVDVYGACAVGDRVSSPDDARHPRVVTLECCGGSERDHCVHERRLIFELPDTCEAVANQRDRVILVSTTHGQNGAQVLDR